ncbi:hypothetical protein [Streptomyces collinus]|uniref:hypothetical protein n=1 Tax=Streptomyces collinus TaxID=42684 RepID=UPI00042416CC|nr:hypothetical protein [Streptomyces collinus]
MSTLALLVTVLVGLAFVVVPAAVAYLAYRHPSARGPMGIGIAAVAAMAAIIVPIALR